MPTWGSSRPNNRKITCRRILSGYPAYKAVIMPSLTTVKTRFITFQMVISWIQSTDSRLFRGCRFSEHGYHQLFYSVRQEYSRVLSGRKRKQKVKFFGELFLRSPHGTDGFNDARVRFDRSHRAFQSDNMIISSVGWCLLRQLRRVWFPPAGTSDLLSTAFPILMVNDT